MLSVVIPNTPYIPYYPQLSFCTLSPHTSIVYVICILSTGAYVMYISFLLLLFTYVDVIHILSENMRIMCTLSAVVLDMFLPNRQCQCHPYIISSTLYISYYIKLIEWNLSQECWVVSFQDHINDLWDNLYWWFSLHVTSGHCSHVICICTCHPHIIWAYAYYVHIICSGPWYIPS